MWCVEDENKIYPKIDLKQGYHEEIEKKKIVDDDEYHPLPCLCTGYQNEPVLSVSSVSRVFGAGRPCFATIASASL